MSNTTEEDYLKIKEPCKSCPSGSGLEATSRGKNKVIYYKAIHAKLMGEGNPYWYKIMDCPRHFGTIKSAHT